MTRRTLAVLLLVAVAGCSAVPGIPGAEPTPAGTVSIQVQNGGPAPTNVTVTVSHDDGTVVSRESDRLPRNVGRTFDVTVEQPGQYDVSIEIDEAGVRLFWRTEDCETPTARVEIGEDGSTHATWACLAQ